MGLLENFGMRDHFDGVFIARVDTFRFTVHFFNVFFDYSTEIAYPHVRAL